MKALLVFVFVFYITSNLLLLVSANSTPEIDSKAKTNDAVELSKAEDLANTMLSKRFDEGNVVMQFVKSLTELSSNLFKCK